MSLQNGDRHPAAPDTAGGFDPEPWRAELLAFARRQGAASDAEDVVQEAFLRALRRPPAGSGRAYLYRVCHNVLRDRSRRERSGAKALRFAARPEAGDDRPAEHAEQQNLAEVTWEVVRRLPEQQRLALQLRIQRHMGYEEIGIVLECSAACARQHFYLAVKSVRNRIGGGPLD